MANSSKTMIPRISKLEFGISVARIVALRGECSRRKVGAVIMNKKGRILSTGCNGLAPGKSCSEAVCTGIRAPSGTNLSGCNASHAEISALVYLANPDVAHTLYCTTEPCIECTKAILLTGIKRIVFDQPYPVNGKHLWDREFWGTYEEALQSRHKW